MQFKLSLLTGSLLVALTLTGCGGGDSSDDSSNNNNLTEEFIRTTIRDITNSTHVIVDDENYPNLFQAEFNNQWDCNSGHLCAYQPETGVAIDDGIKRYNTDINHPNFKKIPVYYWSESGDTYKDPRFMYAMQEIQKLVMPNGTVHDLFEIHNTFANITTDSFRIDYSNLSNEGGIILSLGTATMHGNVGTGPNTGNIAGKAIDNENFLLGDKGWLWLNLDSKEGHVATNEVALHEMAHIFFHGRMYTTDGFGGNTGHFDGFGINGVFNKKAQAVMRNMYANDAGTRVDELDIRL